MGDKGEELQMEQIKGEKYRKEKKNDQRFTEKMEFYTDRFIGLAVHYRRLFLILFRIPLKR